MFEVPYVFVVRVVQSLEQEEPQFQFQHLFIRLFSLSWNVSDTYVPDLEHHSTNRLVLAAMNNDLAPFSDSQTKPSNGKTVRKGIFSG